MKKSEYLKRAYIYIKKNILFFNIKNKYVKNLAYREYCYKKMYKKYKKIIDEYEVGDRENETSDYVWICWFQGEKNAPKLVQKCIESAKKNLPNKKIIILSDENLKEYIEFPSYIEKKYKKGVICPAHYSDLIRLELLKKYGGLWIDATVLVTQEPPANFFEQNLFVYKNITTDNKSDISVKASSWLIYANKNNPIVELTGKLMQEYWKKKNIAISYNLIHLFFSMAAKKCSSEWEQVKSMSNIPPHILQFELEKKYTEERWNEITKMSPFHKLNFRIKTDEKDTFYDFIINKYN